MKKETNITLAFVVLGIVALTSATIVGWSSYKSMQYKIIILNEEIARYDDCNHSYGCMFVDNKAEKICCNWN